MDSPTQLNTFFCSEEEYKAAYQQSNEEAKSIPPIINRRSFNHFRAGGLTYFHRNGYYYRTGPQTITPTTPNKETM